MQLQQAFIHTAKFFGIEIAVVDAGAALALLVEKPADRLHSLQQESVGNLQPVKMDALLSGKQAPQPRQTQR